MRILILLLIASLGYSQNAQWQNFGPTQQLETAAKLCLDPQGNSYVLSNGDTNLFRGSEWFLYKFNAQGQEEWRKQYGADGNYWAANILYINHKLYVAGEQLINDTARAWIEILDTAGQSLQRVVFGSGDSVVVGQDIAYRNGRLGLLNQVRAVSGGIQGAQVLSLDTNLNLLSNHVYYDTASFVAQALVGLDQGKWVYTCDLEIANRFDLLVVKTDAQGGVEQKLLVSNGFTRGGNAIDIDSQGRIAIGGEGASALSVSFDITLTLLDTNLNLIRDVYVRPGVPQNDACFAMVCSPLGTYLFTGYQIAPESGDTRMIVAESDEFGNLLHLDSYGSSPACIGSGITVGPQGNFIAVGSDFNLAPSLIMARGTAKGLALKPHPTSPLCFYPNPSHGIFRWDGASGLNEYSLFNSFGQAVEFESAAGQLKIKEARPGLYFLQSRSNGKSYPLWVK